VEGKLQQRLQPTLLQLLQVERGKSITEAVTMERVVKVKVPMMDMVMVKVVTVNLVDTRVKVEVEVMQDMKAKDMVKEKCKVLHMLVAKMLRAKLLPIKWANTPPIKRAKGKMAMQLIPMVGKASQHLIPIQLDILARVVVARVVVVAKAGIKVGANAVEDLESKASSVDEVAAKMVAAKMVAAKMVAAKMAEANIVVEAKGGLKPTELD